MRQSICSKEDTIVDLHEAVSCLQPITKVFCTVVNDSVGINFVFYQLLFVCAAAYLKWQKYFRFGTSDLILEFQICFDDIWDFRFDFSNTKNHQSKYFKISLYILINGFGVLNSIIFNILLITAAKTI